jgi:hypothetical protein
MAAYLGFYQGLQWAVFTEGLGHDLLSLDVYEWHIHVWYSFCAEM